MSEVEPPRTRSGRFPASPEKVSQKRLQPSSPRKLNRSGGLSPKKLKTGRERSYPPPPEALAATVVNEQDLLAFLTDESHENPSPVLDVGADDHLMFSILDYPVTTVSNYVICRDWFTTNNYPTNWSNNTPHFVPSKTPTPKRKEMNQPEERVGRLDDLLSNFGSKEPQSPAGLFQEFVQRNTRTQSIERQRFQKDIDENGSLKSRKPPARKSTSDLSKLFVSHDPKPKEKERSSLQSHSHQMSPQLLPPPSSVQTRQSTRQLAKK